VLGLIVNAVVLWTTRNQQAALDALRAEGAEVLDEDVARLSPPGSRHVNVLGRTTSSSPSHAGSSDHSGTRRRRTRGGRRRA
jgi:hypothetical protein